MKRKETEFLTEEEAQAILRVPDRRTPQGKRDYGILLTLLTTGLRKAEICNLKVGDPKTYRNQGVIDVVGKGKKFRRIPLKTETLLSIQDYLKANGNGLNSDHPVSHTLGKHGPYDRKCLTPKAVDCLIKSAAKKAIWRDDLVVIIKEGVDIQRGNYPGNQLIMKFLIQRERR
jgi:integrase